MAHNLTETATFDATTPVPDDGDTRNAASVNGAFQVLADRSQYLKNANIATNNLAVAANTSIAAITNGEWLGGPPTAENNTATASSIDVGPIKGLVLGGLVRANATATTVALASLEGGGNLAANGNYYVYANAGSGFSVGLYFSATAPDNTLMWKSTGVGTDRFVCSFHVRALNVIAPFYKIGRKVTLLDIESSAGLNYFHTGTTAQTSFTFASGGGAGTPLIPPHVRVVHMKLLLINDATATPRTVSIASDRATGVTQQLFQFSQVATTAGYVFADFVLGSSQFLAYTLSTAASFTQAAAYLTGFEE